MLVLKIILIVVVLVNIVSCSELKAKSGAKLIERITDNTNNQQPGDAYVSIPVAIVYEKGDRKAKSEDVSKLVDKLLDLKGHFIKKERESENASVISTKSTQDEPKKVSLNFHFENITDSAEESSLKDDSKSEQNINKTQMTKSIDLSKNQNEFQIPVAVIYDPEPVQSKLLTEKNKSVQRNQRKRKYNNGNVDKINSTKIESRKNNKNNINSENVQKSDMNKSLRERKPIIPIIMSENYVFSHSGDFHYRYESGDGTKAFSSGGLKSVNENMGEAVVGSYSYIGSDGNDYSLSYTADENGYRPVGDHLPTPPPIPPAIARALKYLATKTTPEPVTEPTK